MRKNIIFVIIFLAISGFTSNLYLFGFQINKLDDQPNWSLVSNDQIWSNQYGRNNVDDAAYSLVHCHDGGFLLAGSSWNRGSIDVLLLRLEESGQIRWSRVIGGEKTQIAFEVIECHSGGYAIIGFETEDWINFDALLIRTNIEGELVWSRTYGGTGSDRGYTLIECQAGGFLFAGSTSSYGINSTDYWLVQTDSQGIALWNRTFGGPDTDICYSLIEATNEGYVLAGITESFGEGNEDIYLIHIDTAGRVIWDRTYGGYRIDICRQIIQNRNGGYMIVGFTENTHDLIADAFVISIQPNGLENWNCTFGGELENIGYSITECTDGSYAIAGLTAEWNDGQLTTNLWLARLDFKGNYIWSKSYGGFAHDVGWSIIQVDNNDFVIAGVTTSFAVGGTDAWVLRVPDLAPPVIIEQFEVPPNFLLIGLGIILAIVMLSVTYAIYHKSRVDLAGIWISHSKESLLKTFLVPRQIDELAPILEGVIQCRKCNSFNSKGNLFCSKCSNALHRCMFCDEVIDENVPVVFCPSCLTLAHHSHMLEHLKKKDYCPFCGIHLNY